MSLLPCLAMPPLPPLARLACASLLLSHAWAAADTPESALDTVVVKGQGLSKRNEAGSATRLGQEEIREQRASRVQDLFTLVPGMEMRGLQIGGVADSITLRGFAGGGHGGDLGATIDGVPLNEPTSHADGYVDFNILVPLELAGMTVYRGPVSALYGNYARAGVVALESRKGGNYREMDVALGSAGTLDVQGAYGRQTEGLRVNLAAQGWRTDGYRSFSPWSRGTLAGRVAMDLTPDTELALSGRLHRGHWDAIARVSQADLDDGRLYKRPAGSQNDGGTKDYASLRADLGMRLSPQLKLLAFAYGVDQAFVRYSTFAPPTYPDPVGVPWPQRKEDYDRQVFGFGTSLNGRHVVGAGSWAGPLDWVAGLERYDDTTGSRYRQALALREDTPATTDGRNRLQNRHLRFQSTSAFVQGEWAPTPLLRPSLGLRHDRFSGGCRVSGTEFLAGGCGPMNAYARTSPKLGLRSTVAPGLDLRGSWSEGFQLPNDAAKFVPGGDVEPTVFRQVEFGATARMGSNATLDAVLFRVDSSREIYLADAATSTYANLGRTRREGLELDARWFPADDWELHAVASWFTSEVRASSATATVGKKVPNTPRHTATLAATWRPAPGWSATASLRSVGRYALDAANAYWYKGYRVVKAGVQYERPHAVPGHRQRYYLTIDNLFDQRYGASAGVTNGTYFYAPGAPRTVTVGAQFDF